MVQGARTEAKPIVTASKLTRVVARIGRAPSRPGPSDDRLSRANVWSNPAINSITPAPPRKRAESGRNIVATPASSPAASHHGVDVLHRLLFNPSVATSTNAATNSVAHVSVRIAGT